MGWDPTAWAVGGGALHSVEVGRMLAYVAGSGAEGIVGPDDLKVTATPVPGTSVQVATGACLILNRHAGGGQQAYAARRPSAEDLVPITATGSSGGRSDLVIAKIEDPQYPPTQKPADPANTQYVFTRVIENVPPGTERLTDLNLGISGIELARIDLPPNTATITDAMITNLRKVAQPRQALAAWVNKPADIVQASTTTGAWRDWITMTGGTRIPTWAGRVLLRLNIAGAVARNGLYHGHVRLLITTDTGTLATEAIGVREDATAADIRFALPFGDLVEVPAALAGRMASIKVQTNKQEGAGVLQVNAQSTISAEAVWIQAAR